MDVSLVRGLQNLGNSCFMNSALQCITHIKPLSRLVAGDQSNNPDHLIFNIYRDYLKAYYSQNKANAAISPTSLFRNLKKISIRMTPGRQHDSHEFALGVLGFIQDHYKKLKKSEEFEQIFGGKLVSQITCSSCKHVSDSFESMVSLSLVLEDYEGYK